MPYEPGIERRRQGGSLSPQDQRRILRFHDRRCSVMGPPPHRGKCSLRAIAKAAGCDRRTLRDLLNDRAKGKDRRSGRKMPQESRISTPHQDVLLSTVRRIIEWVNDLSMGDLLHASIPRKMPYGGMIPVLTILDSPTRDSAFLALEEHLQGTPLWDSFQQYREVRQQYWSARGELIAMRQEAAQRGDQKMMLAELQKKRDKLMQELDSLQKKVSQGFQELIVAGHVPGIYQHREGTGGG